MFVSEADEAYRIGPAASNESYLKMENILDVCKKSKAEAVHPGHITKDMDFYLKI